jgi:NitT/TauT family transport system substrate-binding protein
MACKEWKNALLGIVWLVGAGSLGIPSCGATEQLRIGLQYGIYNIPFHVARHEGIFERQLAAHGQAGVKVGLQSFSGPPAVTDALLTGQVDMAVIGPPGLIIAWSKSRGTASEIIGVAGVSTMLTSLVALKPELRTLRDIGADDRIAVAATTSVNAYVLRIAAEKQFGNGRVFDQRFVAMPNPDAVSALLNRTEVTAISTLPPHADFALRQPSAHRVLSSLEVFGGPSTSIVLATARRYGEANPKIVQAAIAALDEANALIVREPRRAADIYVGAEPSKVFDAAFVAALLPDGEHDFTTGVTGIMTYVDYMARNGQIKNRPADWKDLFFPHIHGRTGS